MAISAFTTMVTFTLDENITMGEDYSSYEYDLSDAFKHPIQIEIFISLFVWSVSLLTLTGNILVFASFARDPELRSKVSNLFILNLASADFMVGVNSLTLNNLWRYYGNWPFGEGLCKFWLIFDYAATLQSTLAIVLISLDRYLIVTMEVQYRTFMDRQKAGLSIAFTWISSVLFFAVPIIGFDTWGPGSWVNYSVTCDVAVLYEFSYNIITIVYAFVIPGCLLIYFNLNIFMNIRRRSSGLVRSRKIVPLEPTISTVPDPLQEHSQPRSSKATVPEPNEGIDTTAKDVKGRNDKISETVAPAVDSKIKDTVASAGHNPNRDARAQEEVEIQKVARDRRRALKRDKKAATTLAMIVIVYVICWLPYYVTQLIYVYYEKNYYISWRVWNAVYYLVWLNSGLNPCLYAIASPKMRKNFLELLCIWKTFCKP